MKKKLLALSLIFTMALAPAAVFADETDENQTAAEETADENTEPAEEAGTDDNTVEEQSLFADVSGDDWYAEAVDFAVKRGIMSGTSDTEFSPDMTATRGMIALIMRKMDDSTDKIYWSYLDVDEDAWYADAVAWCSENNIMKGYGNGIFGPEDAVSREQLISILYRFAEYKGFGNLETNGIELLDYKDYADISGYAGGPMQWALKINIISGKDGKLLDPKGEATRAEVAQIIRNFMIFYNI